MLIKFIGTGEAWDPDHAQMGILVQGGSNILLDCGTTAAIQLMEWIEDKKDLDWLDAVFFSHFHSDHAGGILPLLCCMSDFDHNPFLKPRKRPLRIIGPEGVEKWTESHIRSMHGFYDRLCYPLEYIEACPGNTLELKGMRMSFAAGRHSREVLAVRIDSGGRSFAYSGDGSPTAGTKKLYRGVDLLAHEAYTLEDMHTLGHGTVLPLLGMAETPGIGRIALVHINRYERREAGKIVQAIRERGLGGRVFIPEDGDETEV